MFFLGLIAFLLFCDADQFSIARKRKMNRASVFTGQIALNLQKNSFSTVNKFSEQRSKYQGQLSELRKVWQVEHQEKVQLKEDQKKAEKKRITVERAIKLREARRLSQARQEQVRLEREKARLRIQENLARTQILWEGRQQQKKKYEALAHQNLLEESKTWIAPQDISSRITEKLFETPSATTGIITPTSNYWKYQIFTPKFARLLSQEDVDPFSTQTGWKNTIKSDYRVTKKIIVDDFLHQLIGTGKERAEFKQLSKDMNAIIASKGGFDTIFDSLVEPEVDETLVEEIEEVVSEVASDVETKSEASDSTEGKKEI